MRILVGLHQEASVATIERELRILGASQVIGPRLLPDVLQADFDSDDPALLQEVGRLPGVRYAEAETRRSI